MKYYIYIVRCNDNSLYTGITTDLQRRLHEHNETKKGAKYTRSRRPVSLSYSQLIGSRSEAQREEFRIKRLTKVKKENLINKTSLV